jgi:hypothetical protein
MEPVPSYEDLVWLFGGEPIRRPAGEPWAYTSATFRTKRAGHDIELDIEPGYQVVRLRLLTASGVKLLDLNLQGVLTVGVERVRAGSPQELLRIDFPDDSPASTLWLQMKPDITIAWSYNSID